MTKRERVDGIYEAIQKVNQVYGKWTSAHGMTLYEMQIYYRIMERSLQKEQAYITQKEQAYITQKELCDELDAPKTSINSIIKRQLKTGYIEMEVNPANRREKIISLTETGKQYARELVLPLFQSEEEAAAQFTEQEMTEAIRMQEKFADALAKSMEEKVSIVHNLSAS